jgi:hypothetical protein
MMKKSPARLSYQNSVEEEEEVVIAAVSWDAFEGRISSRMFSSALQNL